MTMYKSSIFVVIPSYRDAELSMTVDRMIAKADFPRNLTFGICQQDLESEWDLFRRYKDIIDIRLDNYLPEQSNGLCWALSKCHSLYDGEDYFLQIDSHIEFINSWDTVLIDQYQKSLTISHGGDNIFAAYPASYTIDENLNRTLKTEADYVSRTKLYYPENYPFPTGRALPIGNYNRPIKARYLNGGFMFGHGSFSLRVPYDPDIVFWGTEIATSVRAYTHGFNLFHPSERICWHHYGQRLNAKKGSPHIWNPEDDKQREISAHIRNKKSYEIVEQLVQGTYQGQYGLGSVRTLEDYENYVGINFRTKEQTTESQSGIYADC